MLQKMVLGCLYAFALVATGALLMTSVGKDGIGCLGFAFLESCLLMTFLWLFRVTRRLVSDKPLHQLLPAPLLEALLRVLPRNWDIHRKAFIHALETGELVSAQRRLTEHRALLTALDPEHRRPPLTTLGVAGNPRAVRWLLDHHTPLETRDRHGLTPLLAAAHAEHGDVCRLLLEHGADLHAQNDRGMTALHILASFGDLETIQDLLRRGAHPDQRDEEGITPLMRAAENNEAPICTLLLEHGADPSACSIEGITATMLAADFGATEAVEVLLQWGADLSAQDEEGFTALDYAASCGDHWKTLSVMLSHLQPRSLDECFHREAVESHWGPLHPLIQEQVSLYQKASDAPGESPQSA